MSNIDVPELSIDIDLDVELAVSHRVRIGAITVRVLAEPNQWSLQKYETDPMMLFRAYVHPDDWDALDRYLTTVRLPNAKYLEIVTKLLEKPTGYPTNGSGDSSAL